MPKSKYIQGFILAAISSATFGLIPFFSIPLMKSGLELDSLLFYRFAFSSVFLGLYMLVTRKDLKISLKDLGVIFILAIFYGATSLFLTSSYAYMTSSVATTIHFLYPIAVALIMIIFFKEKLSWKMGLAAALAVVGVYFLCGATHFGEIKPIGLVLVLSTVVTYSTFIVGVNQSRVKTVDSLKLTFYVMVCTAVVFYINILVRDGGRIDPVPADTVSWVRIILLALLPTLVSDMSLMYAIKIIGSTTSAILGCMEPLTAVSLGILFLKEPFGPLQIIGAVAVIAAVIIVLLRNKTKNPSRT